VHLPSMHCGLLAPCKQQQLGEQRWQRKQPHRIHRIPPPVLPVADPRQLCARGIT